MSTLNISQIKRDLYRLTKSLKCDSQPKAEDLARSIELLKKNKLTHFEQSMLDQPPEVSCEIVMQMDCLRNLFSSAGSYKSAGEPVVDIERLDEVTAQLRMHNEKLIELFMLAYNAGVTTSQWVSGDFYDESKHLALVTHNIYMEQLDKLAKQFDIDDFR